MSNTFRLHGLQHSRLPCPSLSPGVSSKSCPLSRWCYKTIVWIDFRIRAGLKSPFHYYLCSVQFSSVQSLSHVRLFVTPLTAAHQALLSCTISWSLLKCMSIESVTPSNHLILCCPLLLLLSVFLSIRVFSNESVLCIRWPKYWRFGFSISYSNNMQGWFPLELTGLISLLSRDS